MMRTQLWKVWKMFQEREQLGQILKNRPLHISRTGTAGSTAKTQRSRGMAVLVLGSRGISLDFALNALGSQRRVFKPGSDMS